MPLINCPVHDVNFPEDGKCPRCTPEPRDKKGNLRTPKPVAAPASGVLCPNCDLVHADGEKCPKCGQVNSSKPERAPDEIANPPKPEPQPEEKPAEE